MDVVEFMLTNDHIDAGALSAVLRRHGACIAGSYVLESITNSFNANDINIWTTAAGLAPIKAVLGIEFARAEPITAEFTDVHFSDRAGRTIRIIVVKDVEDAIASFDFHCLKISWDGHILRKHHPDAFTDADSRILTVTDVKDIKRLYETRLPKYYDRGFALA